MYHYHAELCGPTLSARSSRSLCSTVQGLLRVPFAQTSNRQKHAFSVIGPTTWNGLPLTLRSLPRTLSQEFLSQLKMVVFGHAGVGGTSEWPLLNDYLMQHSTAILFMSQ